MHIIISKIDMKKFPSEIGKVKNEFNIFAKSLPKYTYQIFANDDALQIDV